MNIRTGVDIVHVQKLKRLMENEAALGKVFHARELERFEAEHLAGIFAAKEAVFKALRINPDWLSVELKNLDNGAPVVELSSELQSQVKTIDVSISHDNEYAIASVVVLME